MPADCLIGAGTVLTPEQVDQVEGAGGQVIVMPHGDPKVLRAAKAAGLFLSPGVATPTEAFAALAEGADVLKLFPAEQMGPAVVKAWLAVLPAGTALLPVGGITPDNMEVFVDAGVNGFGIGSALFKPGMTPTKWPSRQGLRRCLEPDACRSGPTARAPQLFEQERQQHENHQTHHLHGAAALVFPANRDR